MNIKERLSKITDCAWICGSTDDRDEEEANSDEEVRLEEDLMRDVCMLIEAGRKLISRMERAGLRRRDIMTDAGIEALEMAMAAFEDTDG